MVISENVSQIHLERDHLDLLNMFKRRYDDLRVDIKMRKNSCRSRHVALTIAGSDSSSAAGIQGDLRMFSALGVYACTVITAITAQNTREIRNVAPIRSRFGISSNFMHNIRYPSFCGQDWHDSQRFSNKSCRECS